jgi:hypothetical protein
MGSFAKLLHYENGMAAIINFKIHAMIPELRGGTNAERLQSQTADC